MALTISTDLALSDVSPTAFFHATGRGLSSTGSKIELATIPRTMPSARPRLTMPVTPWPGMACCLSITTTSAVWIARTMAGSHRVPSSAGIGQTSPGTVRRCPAEVSRRISAIPPDWPGSIPMAVQVGMLVAFSRCPGEPIYSTKFYIRDFLYLKTPSTTTSPGHHKIWCSRNLFPFRAAKSLILNTFISLQIKHCCKYVQVSRTLILLDTSWTPQTRQTQQGCRLAAHSAGVQ